YAALPPHVFFPTRRSSELFGSKAAGYPQLAIPALLSRKAGGRPVMMRVTRLEEFYFGRCRAGFQGRVRLGFRADGRITALDLYRSEEHTSELQSRENLVCR